MRANARGILSICRRVLQPTASKGGLIVAEGTQISRQGQGYPQTPGIYNDAQVAGWKPSLMPSRPKAVSSSFNYGTSVELHSSLHENGSLPVAPSAIAAKGNAFTSTFARVPRNALCARNQ
jgi:N-ethylmaleimide reductase